MTGNESHVLRFFRNQGGLGTISKLNDQCLEIIRDSTWIGREDSEDTMAALDPYSLDVWYGALALLHSQAMREQTPELRQHVQALADFLDKQPRSEALFFKHFGLVPRDADYSHIKLRYQRANDSVIQLLEKFEDEEQKPEPQIFFTESRPLKGFSDVELLDILLLAFNEMVTRDAYSLVKTSIIELEHRRDLAGELDVSHSDHSNHQDSGSFGAVPNENTTNSQDQLEMVYRFYINGVEPEEGVWGCVATSEQEAFAKAKERGLKDFFLSNTEEAPLESRRDQVMLTLLANPNLGPAWVPIAEAFELCSSSLTYRSATWVVNTLMRSNNFSPDNSPYLQAILESDGSIHVEVSGRLAIKNLSDENLALLQFIGWSVPEFNEDDPAGEEGLPNPYRLFEVGWGALQVAAFVLETLVTVFEFQEGDFFDFSSASRSEAIAKLGTLERVTIHDGNPDGTIFRLIQPKQP